VEVVGRHRRRKAAEVCLTVRPTAARSHHKLRLRLVAPVWTRGSSHSDPAATDLLQRWANRLSRTYLGSVDFTSAYVAAPRVGRSLKRYRGYAAPKACSTTIKPQATLPRWDSPASYGSITARPNLRPCNGSSRLLWPHSSPDGSMIVLRETGSGGMGTMSLPDGSYRRLLEHSSDPATALHR
jgi:hypothetical protein